MTILILVSAIFYSYVCDCLVSNCASWSTHCHATCRSEMWRKARKDKADALAAAAADIAAQASLATLSTSTSTMYSSSSSSSVCNATTSSFSITELMKAVTQVYPEETCEPISMRQNMTLRPYQKQSLAFALNVELRPASADESTLPPVGSYPSPAHGNKPAPCYSGWICDEMGMGKTAVIIALCVANPAPSSLPRSSDVDWETFVKCGRHKARPKEFLKIKAPVGAAQRRYFFADRKKSFFRGRWHQKNPAWEKWKPPMKLRNGYHLRLKATIILTNVSLLGQWEDEFKRFAPHLKLRRHFGQKRWTTAEVRYLSLLPSARVAFFSYATSLFFYGPAVRRLEECRCHIVVYESKLRLCKRHLQQGIFPSGCSRRKRYDVSKPILSKNSCPATMVCNWNTMRNERHVPSETR